MAGMGLSASPLFAKVAFINPAILPTSILISSGIFGAASAFAYMKPKNSLMGWGDTLYSSVLGMIGL